MKKVTLATAALCALSTGVSAQNVLVDFNNAATDLSSNFTGTTTVTAFSWTNNVGVSGGGGVTVSTDTGGANYNYNTAYDFGAGSATNTWTVSAFFKTNATTGTSANQIAGVGFATDQSDEFGTASAGMLAMTLRYASNTNGALPAATVQIAVANNPAGTNTNTLQGSSFVAATNTWYKMIFTVTKTATADTFSLSGLIENWGASGASFSSSVTSFTNQSFTNAGVYGDSSLFAGFFARQTSGNPIQIQAVDNFQVIPEPSSFAALAGLGALGFVATRRRRA